MNLRPCDFAPVCCKKPCKCGPGRGEIDFYAQFGVRANPPSNSLLPFYIIFEKGSKIIVQNDTEILLPAGFLYLINFVFIASPEPGGFMEIVPMLNASPGLVYSFFAPANNQERNTSASGSFTTQLAAEENAVLSFSLTYSDTARNIDISGAVSVTPQMAV